MDEFLNGEEGGDLPSEILIPKYQLQVIFAKPCRKRIIIKRLIDRILPMKLQSWSQWELQIQSPPRRSQSF